MRGNAHSSPSRNGVRPQNGKHRGVPDVILPVLDEAAAIPWVLERMPPDCDPLVVDNGSTDGWGDIALRLGARVIVEPVPGFGAACFAGLEASRADLVCFMDCDGSLGGVGLDGARPRAVRQQPVDPSAGRIHRAGVSAAIHPARSTLAQWKRAASATSRSSRTSTTASRRWPTASSRSPAPCRRARWRRRSSTRWTSSASAASPSRRIRSACNYTADDGEQYVLNLIDTPGHVDFSYEVTRSLAACEGALLLVDASQGVEAQTLANAYLAVENNLEIIPVINKIDLPSAAARRGAAPDRGHHRPRRRAARSWPAPRQGTGVDEILEAIVERLPPPERRSRRAAQGADLRLLVRPLPRRRHRRPRDRRRAAHRA